MRIGKTVLTSACIMAVSASAFAAAHPRKGATKLVPKHAVAKAKMHMPLGIDDQRATEIQGALIKSGYLTGAPSGHWDTGTQAAMEKLQADNGWQTKLVPDSRGLIKLGLGPETPQ